MTIIVYKDGVLASDSAAVTGMSITYITYHQKIELSKCKRFAWGTSGAVIDPVYLEEFQRLMVIYLINCRSFGSEKPMGKELFKILMGRDMIIMTLDTVYVCRRTETSLTLVKLLEGEFAAVGTGRILATAALLKDKTAVQATQFAIEHDFYSYRSKVLTIKRKSLKQLPVEIK